MSLCSSSRRSVQPGAARGPFAYSVSARGAWPFSSASRRATSAGTRGSVAASSGYASRGFIQGSATSETTDRAGTVKSV